MKQLAIAASCCLVLTATPATAGMDTFIQFTNLSPYQATIEFPPGQSSCWYGDGAQDRRIAEYFDYFRRDAVSDNSYREFLTAYKESYGLPDLATVRRYDMTTTTSLAPAAVGDKVDTALFVGETSAALFQGCKFATSNLRFNVTMRGADGSVLGRQEYLLQDPPSDQWTLSQLHPGTQEPLTTILMGSGGHGNPWEIGISSAIAVITVVSLGSATAELIAARAALAEAATLAAEIATALSEESIIVRAAPLWRTMLSYALDGGIGYTARASLGEVVLARSGTIAARLLYTTIANGGLVIYALNRDEDLVRLAPGEIPDSYRQNVDFSAATLVANSALPEPDERSICVYQTGTLGVTECRVVGINLTIMPNGTLVFMPMPAVGRGD